ncbi:Glutathione S-transferase, partial [Musa troglodytarum]
MTLKVYGHLLSQPSRAIIIFCDHAILCYLASAFPGVPDHCTLGPVLSLPLNPQAAIKDEKILKSVWLKGDAKFLLGNFQPSVADLSLACEIMQLEVVDEKDRERILGSHPKILEWIDNVKSATSPHFEEVHEHLQEVKASKALLNHETDIDMIPRAFGMGSMEMMIGV